MPWLRMTAQDAEKFDADMLERVRAIKGRATRYSWPEEATEKGMVAVLVASEHVARLPVSTKGALLFAKPDVIESIAGDRQVVEPGGKAVRP